MRILVTGAKGQLGQELQRVLRGEEVIAADRPDYEVTDPVLGEKIAAQRPALVIHAAAYTDVDGCERHPETAFTVNASLRRAPVSTETACRPSRSMPKGGSSWPESCPTVTTESSGASWPRYRPSGRSGHGADSTRSPALRAGARS